MEKPKVSYVVPTHERVEWIAECVTGLLAQTIRDIEVVIVVDGSKDGTMEFLKDWLKGEERVKIHYNEKSIDDGLSRNKGIELATADIIGVCDDDDCYPVQRTERILKFFEKHPKGVMMNCPYVRIGYVNEVLQEFRGEPFNEEYFKKSGGINYFCHPSSAYKKADILEVGGYKAETKDYTDDYQLVDDWIKAGKKIGFYPEEFLCLHRVLPTSMMSKKRGFDPEWTGKAA